MIAMRHSKAAPIKTILVPTWRHSARISTTRPRTTGGSFALRAVSNAIVSGKGTDAKNFALLPVEAEPARAPEIPNRPQPFPEEPVRREGNWPGWSLREFAHDADPISDIQDAGARDR